ncbi:hypothetical protein CGRA01v4_04957 [Colletotrichum graminicola]|nr:hypothetical protein CGRA01v4_04957 [Colletotrichum graminicola]
MSLLPGWRQRAWGYITDLPHYPSRPAAVHHPLHDTHIVPSYLRWPRLVHIC